MNTRDVWGVARLLCGADHPDDPRPDPGPLRELADRLTTLPIEGRQAVWNAFLMGSPDRDELIRMVDAADPDGPLPDPASGGNPGDDWPPLRPAELPGVPAFPTDVLPLAAERLVIEGAAAIGCAPDFLGLAVLVVAGGVIGRTLSLLLKAGYFASACLFGICVGHPSDGKSPALGAVLKAVLRIAEALALEHKRAVEEWEAEEPEKGKKPRPKPSPRRIVVDDITLEAVPIILAQNSRGLLMANDELSGLFLGLNQYKPGGKGSDRAGLLAIWTGQAITKDRVNHEANIPIQCPHPFLAIIGNLTPVSLGNLSDRKGTGDGLPERFLYCYPDPRPVPPWSDRGIPDDVADDWADLVIRLWSRPMRLGEGGPIPHVAHFTPEGKAAWSDGFDALAAEMNRPDFPIGFRGAWGKMRDQAARLALIVATIHHAADSTLDPAAVPEVDAAAVRNAWRLVDYFKGHARRVHAEIERGPGGVGGRTASVIVAWIREGGLTKFTVHDLKQARRGIEGDDLADGLATLATRGAIRKWEPAPIEPKGGRRPSPTYDVNPALLATRNPQSPQYSDPSPEITRPFGGSEGFEGFEDVSEGGPSHAA